MVSKSNKFFLKIGKYFGVLPWLDFRKCELINKWIFRVYPATVAVILFLEFIRLLGTSKRGFNDVTTVTLTTCTLYAIIQSSYVKRMEWMKLFHLYGIAKKEFITKLKESLDLGWRDVYIYMTYVTYLTSIRIVSHFNSTRRNSLLLDVMLIIKLTSDYLPVLFFSILSKGFKILNNYSKRLLIGEKINFNKTPYLNGTTATICRNQYRNLYNISVGVNDLFSWLLAMALFNSLVTMLLFTQFMINRLFSGQLNLNSIFFFGMIFIYRLVSTFSSST